MIYSTLAGYYDQLVGDEESIDRWVDWIESWNPGKEFLELACGSGSITHKLAKNHHVSAMDLSQDMIDEASRKDTDLEIAFSVGDMKDLSAYGTYDAIGCFCDSFNYILAYEQVQKFFRQVAEHLVPGGLFLFDTHAVDRLDEFEEDYVELGTFEDGTKLQWTIAAEEDYIFQDFAFYFPDRTVQEPHMQKVYAPDALMEALDPCFEILSVRTDFEQEGITPGEKYFFACKRRETI